MKSHALCTCPGNHPGLGLCHKPPPPAPDQELHGQWPDAPDTHKDMKTDRDVGRGGDAGSGLMLTGVEKRGISIASPIYLIRLRKTTMEWRWLPSFTWNSRNQTTSHLVRLVPLGRVGVVHMFGGEMLRADPCYGIRVGQAGHHPFHVAVLSCQVLCLQQVDPHHSL